MEDNKHTPNREHEPRVDDTPAELEAKIESDTDEVVDVEEVAEQGKKKRQGRRQIFGLLGILLVYYYVYQTFKPIFKGEVPQSQRTGLIIAGSLLLIANIALTIYVVRDWWRDKKAAEKAAEEDEDA